MVLAALNSAEYTKENWLFKINDMHIAALNSAQQTQRIALIQNY